MTEDEMAGWHHGLDGRESEWTPGDGDGHGGLVCCISWGRKESDMTERLNWTDSSTGANMHTVAKLPTIHFLLFQSHAILEIWPIHIKLNLTVWYTFLENYSPSCIYSSWRNFNLIKSQSSHDFSPKMSVIADFFTSWQTNKKISILSSFFSLILQMSFMSLFYFYICKISWL